MYVTSAEFTKDFKVIIEFSEQLLDNDDRRIKSYHARFIGHVFPGETYEIQIWKNGNKWIFLASVVERKTKALVG